MPSSSAVGTPERIEVDAARSDVSEIASYLQEHLGQRTTAYLSGLTDTKVVGQWAASRAIPRELANLRLRNGYQAARIIVEAFGEQAARAWFFGANSQLDHEAPAYFLRHSTSPDTASVVVRAARSFAEVGRRDEGPEEAKRDTEHMELLLIDMQRLKEVVETALSKSPNRTQQDVSRRIDGVIKRLVGKVEATKSASR